MKFRICTDVNLLEKEVDWKCSAKASCHGPIRPNELRSARPRRKWCSSTDAKRRGRPLFKNGK